METVSTYLKNLAHIGTGHHGFRLSLAIYIGNQFRRNETSKEYLKDNNSVLAIRHNFTKWSNTPDRIRDTGMN